ncbi:MAG: hypothetical protein H6631_08330 [Anaerolineaceae bacterium]|nr:hypothetical protein [Anaerolineaceae bacterium]MCB9099088.1 hypothetical protein [Anaerolineales bacterium]
MRSGFNKIVVLVIGLVIFVTGSTAIITLAQEPSNLPQENSGAITVDIAPAVFASHYYAENPELMAAQRVAVDNVPAQSASQFYAENPELLAAHRVEAGSPVDNALDTEPHHPRLRGMLVY